MSPPVSSYVSKYNEKCENKLHETLYARRMKTLPKRSKSDSCEVKPVPKVLIGNWIVDTKRSLDSVEEPMECLPFPEGYFEKLISR